jgi:recombination protein RecA
MRRVTGSQRECAVFWINQIREKMGVMFGSPETTPGGKAIDFYSSLTFRVSKGEKIVVPRQVFSEDSGEWEVSDQVVGHWANISFKKNKMAPQNKDSAKVALKKHHESGYPFINRPGELIVMAQMYGVIQKQKQTYNSDLLRFRTGKGADDMRAQVTGRTDRMRKLEIVVDLLSKSGRRPSPGMDVSEECAEAERIYEAEQAEVSEAEKEKVGA